MELFFGTTKGLSYSPVRSEAVQEAVQAADHHAGMVEAHHESVDSTDAPQMATHEFFKQQGHALQWDGLACICVRCAGSTTDVTRKVLKLKAVCPGAAKDPDIRKNQVKTIIRFAKARSIEFLASVEAQMRK